MVGHRTAVCCGYRLCGGTVVERSASRSRSAIAAVRSALVGSVRRPVVAILVLAGLGDILSGDPVVHGSALVLVGAAIALDGRRHRTADLAAVPVDRGSSPAALGTVEPVVPLRPALVLGGGALALLVGAFARYSWPATIAVAIPAVAGVAIAWRTPAGRTDPGPVDPLGARAWAGVFVALGLYELTNLLLQPTLTHGSRTHPTVSVLLDPSLASHPGRTAFLAVWLAAGWFLVER
jgi:hypothetical protein